MHLLIAGDTANFNPNFGEATVISTPGVLQASGDVLKYVGALSSCVEGDEKKIKVVGCSYITAKYSIPGEGTVTIEKLDAQHTPSGVILLTDLGPKRLLTTGVNMPFTAKFEVAKPAQEPPQSPEDEPTPDPTPSYLGTGTFKNLKTSSKALK